MILRPLIFAVSLLAAIAPGRGQDVDAPPSHAGAVAAIARTIEAEMAAKGVPALSIALVDDRRVVWSRGFGMARDKVPATSATVHRVGSVSKLFTDIAAMQLVEQGKLDLDAPIQAYLPDFHAANPFGRPITVRMLMTHRSGLVRESPVGHYFDPTGPSLGATVNSLGTTALVYEPGTRTKYSNAAIATVGLVVERLRGVPFGEAVKSSVLDPLGMSSSGFDLSPAMKAQLADARMWTVDGRTFPAPTFGLGIAPAGNLYSTAADLSRFVMALFEGGKVVRPETLASMFTIQYAKADERRGFGLGFLVDEFRGRRRVGHSGAVYGFATEVSALPADKLGVVVVATKDCANGLTRQIGDLCLDALIAVKEGKPLPDPASTTAVPADLARRLEGRYGEAGDGVDIANRAGRLTVSPRGGGQRMELRMLGDALMVDDPIARGLVVKPDADALIVGGRRLPRVAVPAPSPTPAAFGGLIGEYGWDFNTLYIYEQEGTLHALIEWFFDYPLTREADDVYAFPRSGLYDGEKLMFARDAAGRASRVVAASVAFERRPIAGEDGKTYKIVPSRPVAELREVALKASPPAEAGEFRAADLVDLASLDPSIKLDIRYATADNFAGTPFYTRARAYMQRPAAEALLRAHRSLAGSGFGLRVHDAYRPWHVTKMFWDATPESGRGFVADPAKGSKHNRGAAVDLTLYDLETGQPAAMPGGYDEFSGRSNPDYPGGTSRQRWHRDTLRRAMEDQGFSVFPLEWWHYDFKDWDKYAISNATFEEIDAHRAAMIPAGPTIEVGVARVDITPEGPIRLHGYQSRKEESRGVAQRLYAKALALGDDARGPSVVVTVDNLGVPASMVEDLAARLAKAANLPRERLVVAASHTHSAPCLTGVAPNIFAAKVPDDQQSRIDAYTRKLADMLERVALQALKDRAPASLSWTQGRVGFAANRRQPPGPVDHTLPVLRALGPDGRVRAILANYACHCTTLEPRDNLVGGDWAGHAQEGIERDHPGCVALTLIGCGADANPSPRLKPEHAAQHGRALADEVKRLMAGDWVALGAPPTGRIKRISLPFDAPPTRPELEAMAAKNDAAGYNAKTQLARLDRGEALQSTLDYPIQTWTFGDRLAMVFLPGEVVVDYALRIKAELDPTRLWVTAYANDLPCYIPSERILREGGYEGGLAMSYYARPSKLKAGVEDLIIKAVYRLIPDAFEVPKIR